MADYDSFLPEVISVIPDVPDPVAINEIRNAAIELCEFSNYLRTTLTPTVVAGTREYTLAPASGSVVSEILKAKYGEDQLVVKTQGQLDTLDEDWETETGDPTCIVQENVRTFVLAPYPAADATVKTLTLRVGLKPAADSTSCDDTIYEEFHSGISAGAVAALLLMPDKPWSSAGLAASYLARFTEATIKARSRAEGGHGRRVRQVRYGGL